MRRIFNERLREYCNQDYYPWHMPGHKRQRIEAVAAKGSEVGDGGLHGIGFGFSLDVTEVPGLDNLHVPEGVLAESLAQLPAVYGSLKSYYLVNGSTAGILTAVSAVCNRGDTIIMSRNCHKAVYNIVALLELAPVYLYPEMLEPYGICGSIMPEQVEQALQAHPEAKAVIFPSPTYEGILSDVCSISRIVHQAGSRLIVDAAHGAHLEFGKEFPDAAARCGADLVIESLHKTLPCYTQCAILHVGAGATEAVKKAGSTGKAAEAETEGFKCGENDGSTGKCADFRELTQRVERYLRIYQTSSPSYLLVANMEDCIATMEEWRETRMVEYYNRLRRYREKWSGLQTLHLLTTEEVQASGGFAYDESKLVFCMPEGSWTGEEFRRKLEEKYGQVLEMAALNYGLAMTSVMDTEEGFERLNRALNGIDQELSQCMASQLPIKCQMDMLGVESDRPVLSFLPGTALDMESEWVPLPESTNRTAGDYVAVYPPGIPILVPGEQISSSQEAFIQECIRAGLTVHGLQWHSQGKNERYSYIKVIREQN